MTRVKKTIGYINELCLSKVAEKPALGDKLKTQYAKWKKLLTYGIF